MKAFQCTARRFGVEGPGGYAVCVKIIKQGPRNGGLADPALIRAYYNHDWLRHVQTPRSSQSNARSKHGCLVWAGEWRKQGDFMRGLQIGKSESPQSPDQGRE